jgi:hypothetical protein
MRKERDASKTDSEALRVENGILRMRLAAATERKTASSDEVEELCVTVQALEAGACIRSHFSTT